MNQVQDHANERSVALSIKATKITARLLAGAMQAFLKRARSPTQKHGKQSLKSLSKQGAALENVEVSGDNISAFRKVARKYNIDFALKKDAGVTPSNWIVFFKSKDTKSLDAAFTEFSKGVLRATSLKPSIDEVLNKSKDKAKTAEGDLSPKVPIKSRSKDGMEL